MRIKHFLASGALVVTAAVGVIMIGLTSSVFAASACACVTVNEEVVYELNELDSIVQKYANGHNGLLPTYDELVIMTTERQWMQRHLTPQADITTGTFMVSPTMNEVNQIGYAVSADRLEYILIGVGLNEKYKDTYLFGRWIGRDIIGYELPILRPGDTPPPSSPPA
jgi:hypothetical protein